MKEPPKVKNANNQYRKKTDNVGSFIENNIEPDNSEGAYICLTDIWTRYQSSDEYEKTVNKTTLKSLLVKKLGVQCPTRSWINGQWKYSAFIGYQLITFEEKIQPCTELFRRCFHFPPF